MKKLLFCILMLNIVLLAACGGAEAPGPVAEGILVPHLSVELSFAQPDILAEVSAAQGDRVYKTMITLDEANLRFLWSMTATVTIRVE